MEVYRKLRCSRCGQKPVSRTPEENFVYLGKLLMEAETVWQAERGFRRFVAKKCKSRAKKRKGKKKM